MRLSSAARWIRDILISFELSKPRGAGDTYVAKAFSACSCPQG
jgi:hypothetical protein